MNTFDICDFSFSYPLSDYKINLHGSLSIRHGDCILLQGTSGCGKSTLLMALKGLIPYLINGNLSGEIKYHGKDITTLTETELLSIGYLQQNPDSQLICRNVYSELAFGLENIGLQPEKINAKIQQIATQFNITHLLNRDVVSLSGGEKQKINLIAILAMEPNVLLLDEPTAFLDPESAHEIIAILNTYIKNKTIIIIEHNQHYLKPLVNRVISIQDDGKLNEIDINNIVWSQTAEQLDIHNKIERNPILNIKNLAFNYQNQNTILKKINLKLHLGEIIAIHGTNGAGKSTLLKCISKILPSSNSIFYNESPIESIHNRIYWQNLALLWQNPEIHFIYNNVINEVDGQYDILEKFNLTHQAKQNPFTLSEGQKRRLSLAIAFSKNAQIYLLDEPSFGQDLPNKQLLIKMITQMANLGHSFIIISHDLYFSKSLTTQIYQLKDGILCCE